MKDHQRYKSGPVKQGESRFRYVFTHPEDKQRDIIVTLMLFNIPKRSTPARKPGWLLSSRWRKSGDAYTLCRASRAAPAFSLQTDPTG